MAGRVLIEDDGYMPSEIMDGTMAKGLVPRDMKAFPMGAFAPASTLVPPPRKEIDERIRERQANKLGLRHVVRRTGKFGGMIPSVNQNDPKYSNLRKGRWGYCWYYASVVAAILLRAKMGQPWVDFNPFAGAYTFKNGQDEGDWGARSLALIEQQGIVLKADWAEFEQRMRAADDPAWLNAAKYKFTDSWEELEAPIYDRDLSVDQIDWLLVSDIPVVADFNHMGHCMCLYDVYFDERVRLVRVCWNSWGDEYSQDGEMEFTGSKAIPDNSVAPRLILAS